MKRLPKKRTTKHLHADPRIVGAWFKQHGLPVPVAEYRIDPSRRFRWDWAWPDHCVALECQGGIWNGGAHGRGWGIKRDMEKSNIAACHGWLTLSCEPKELMTVETVAMVRTCIQQNIFGRVNLF